MRLGIWIWISVAMLVVPAVDKCLHVGGAEWEAAALSRAKQHHLGGVEVAHPELGLAQPAVGYRALPQQCGDEVAIPLRHLAWCKEPRAAAAAAAAAATLLRAPPPLPVASDTTAVLGLAALGLRAGRVRLRWHRGDARFGISYCGRASTQRGGGALRCSRQWESGGHRRGGAIGGARRPGESETGPNLP